MKRTVNLITFATNLDRVMKEYEKTEGVMPRIKRIDSPVSKGAITITFDDDREVILNDRGQWLYGEPILQI